MEQFEKLWIGATKVFSNSGTLRFDDSKKWGRDGKLGGGKISLPISQE